MEAFHLKPLTPAELLSRTQKGVGRGRAQGSSTCRRTHLRSPSRNQSQGRQHQPARHHLHQHQHRHQHSQRRAPSRHWGHDHWTSIMMTMLFVVSIVLTGNSALAAQRDSFKPKDPNTINNNANAILNEISSGNNGISGGAVGGIVGDGTGAAAGGAGNVGNGNTASHGNTNSISNGNANANNVNGGPGNAANVNMAKTAHSNAVGTTAGGGYATTNSPVRRHASSAANQTRGSPPMGASSLVATSSYKSSHATGNRNAIEQPEMVQNGPYFDKAASKNVTALLGKTAYLNCRVKNLGNKTMLLQVSWVRHRDIHLLTVGRYTYTSDQRFRAIHQPQTEDWILQIKYPQHRDSGVYECQVSTTPHMSHYIHLNVVEPSTEIIGAPDLYIESGSTINLTCVILNSPEPPAYIFWNHNNAIINYDSPRGGVSVVTNKGETTTSFLLIKSARPSDSGHYQCNPSNSKPKSVTVHVLNGEFPAAMQHAALAHPLMSPNLYILAYLSMYLFTLAYVRHYTRLPAAVGAAAAM